MQARILIVDRDEGHLFLFDGPPPDMHPADIADLLPVTLELRDGISVEELAAEEGFWSFQDAGYSKLVVGRDESHETADLHCIGTGCWIVHTTPEEYQKWHDETHGS